MPEAITPTSRRLGGRLVATATAGRRKRARRACALSALVVAAASLAVISPPASEPAEALEAVPLDPSCAELNAMVGRPTNANIVHQGVKFVSDASVGPGSNNSYSNGETVRIEVELSLNVRWDVRYDLDSDAKPLSVTFMLGDSEKAAEATPATGEDNNILTFDYTLDSSDGSHNAGDVWIPENSVRANDSAFKFGKDGNTIGNGVPHQEIHGPCGGADLEHPAVFHPQRPGSPTIISTPKIMSEPLDGDSYYEGEKIWVRVEYSEPVRVTGTPVLKLRFGTDSETNPTYKNASFVPAYTNRPEDSPDPPDDPRRRSSMTRLLFEYVVQGGSTPDSDPDGFSIDWGELSGGSITAMDNGVTATLRHDGLAARTEASAHEGGDPTIAQHFVDGSRGPKMSQELQDGAVPAHVLSYSTRVVSESLSGTTLHEGEYIVVRAEFNEAVVVEDTRLELPIQLFNCHSDDFRHRSQLSGTALDDYDDELEELGCWNTTTDMREPAPLRYAKYLSGSGHTRLLFYYQITSQDRDRDGIVVPKGNFTYDGGKEITSSILDSIITAHDDGTIYTHYADVFEKPLKYQRADGQAVEGPPIILELTITSDPNDGDNDPLHYYEFEDTIEIRVTFNQGVVVTGIPLLTLNIGGELEDAEYTSGDGTRLLLFQYTVEAGDEDVNGISINRDSLKLGNGTLTALDDGEDASLDHDSLGNQNGHKVDAGAPTITRLRIASSPPNGGTYYGVGSHIDIEVTYDEAVTVTGTPSLDFELGTATKTATYDQAASDADSNGRTIVLRYTVISGDSDDDGIGVPAPDIVGGTITEVTQNPNPLPADRDFAELARQTGHRVETDPPEVESSAGSVAFTSRGTGTGGKYLADDTISVTVTFDEVVYVDDDGGNAKPYIGIDLGSGPAKQAQYVRGSGGSNRKLVFSYEVEEGLEDTDGISIDANSLFFNGGDITDRAGNRAIVDHDAVDASTTHTVDSIVPTISPLDIDITSTPPNSGDTYGLGNTITFEVSFSEDVTVSGTAQLRFQIGDDQTNPSRNNRNATARTANLSAGCAEDVTTACTLTFSYTVTSADDDNDGISIDLDTTLPEPETTAITGTIKDRTGNRANLSHNSLGNQSGHKVDAQPPNAHIVDIIDMGPEHLNTHNIGDIIEIEVTFDDPIELTLTDGDNDGDDRDEDDAPYLRLQIGSSSNKLAYYSSHSSDTVTFGYTVVEGDLDTNGISVVARSLRLQSATLQDP